MGLFDSFTSINKAAFSGGTSLFNGLFGAPGSPKLPPFPTFDPIADAQRALSAEEHQKAVTRSMYSLSGFILAGGKPAAYQSNLGG